MCLYSHPNLISRFVCITLHIIIHIIALWKDWSDENNSNDNR